MEFSADLVERGVDFITQRRFAEGFQLLEWASDAPATSEARSSPHYVRAIRWLKAALAVHPEDAALWLAEGVVRLHIRTYERAGGARVRVDEILPRGSWGEDAVYCLQKAVELQPSSAQAHLYLGIALHRIGKRESHTKAIEEFDTAVRLDPDCARAWYQKGIAQADLGKLEFRFLEQSVDSFKEAIRINPTYQEAWFNAGVAHRKLGHLDLEISCMEKATSLNPADADAWYNLGTALVGRGSLAEALDCLKKAVEFNSAHRNAWNNQALIFHKLGQRQRAISCWEKAADLGSPEAKASLDDLEGRYRWRP